MDKELLQKVVDNQDTEINEDNVAKITEQLSQINGEKKFWGAVDGVPMNDPIIIWKLFALIRVLLLADNGKAFTERARDEKQRVRELGAKFQNDKNHGSLNRIFAEILILIIENPDILKEGQNTIVDKQKIVEIFETYISLLQLITDSKMSARPSVKATDVKLMQDGKKMCCFHGLFFSPTNPAEPVLQKIFTDLTTQFEKIGLLRSEMRDLKEMFDLIKSNLTSLQTTMDSLFEYLSGKLL